MNEGYRKAALKLHRLSALDRKWMLQRLPPQDRALLFTLLDELQELGIRSDHGVADDLSRDDARNALLQAGGNVPDLMQALDALCAAHPAQIFSLLATEPDNMAAVMLSVYPWPWRDRLLADYGVEKRQRVNRALRQVPQLKSRLRAELVKTLADRLASQCVENRAFEQIRPHETLADHSPRPRALLQGLRRWLP